MAKYIYADGAGDDYMTVSRVFVSRCCKKKLQNTVGTALVYALFFAILCLLLYGPCLPEELLVEANGECLKKLYTYIYAMLKVSRLHQPVFFSRLFHFFTIAFFLNNSSSC